MLAAATLLISGYALAALAVTPDNLPTPSTSGALTALKYVNVGGTGSYDQVTGMPPGEWPTCTPNPSCIKSTVTVSGNLAPFDEDMTMVFRGPAVISSINVYQASSPSAQSWNLASSYSNCQQPNNLVWMNNDGGQGSGEWSICQGASQSFANSNFTSAAAAPSINNGQIPAGHEANIMTTGVCGTPGVDCQGFFRGTANIGWSGSKAFIFDIKMPGNDPSMPPAVWMLPGQVVRSAQYGCNCRGMGGQGGCGEIDILEVLENQNPSQAITEIYSFKGATGGGNDFFPRPLTRSTYMVILDIQTDQIAIMQLTHWDYTQTSIDRDTIDAYLNVPAKIVSFN